MTSRSTAVGDASKVAVLIVAALVFGPVMVALAFLLPILAYLVLPALFVMSIVAFPTYFTAAGVRYAIQTRRAGRPLFGVPVYAEAKKAGAPSRIEAAAEQSTAPALAVSARVIELNGSCPAGHRFEISDQFIFPNGHAVPTLCKKAELAMHPLVEGLRSGELAPGQQWVCQGPYHKVIFRLDPVTVPGSAGTGGKAAA